MDTEELEQAVEDILDRALLTLALKREDVEEP